MFPCVSPSSGLGSG